MENLEVIDLYENYNKTKIKKFQDKVDSTLKVDLDIKKTVRDVEWISMVKSTVPYIDNIFRSPNRFIVNEEEIVKVEQAKKITVETIKHLSKNTNFIQTIDKKTGDVTPSKLLNVRKEETYDTYENRLIYTLIKNIKTFINRRKDSLMQEIRSNNAANRNNKAFEYNASSAVNDEEIKIDVSLKTSLNSSDKEDDDPQKIMEAIEDVERDVQSLEGSEVYKILDKSKIAEVRDPVKKTNVILKNVNFQYAMKLWDFLRDNFDDKTTTSEEKKKYEDNGQLKNMMNESFLLQYLTIKTLDDDRTENEETREELKNVILEQLIDKMLDMNDDITEHQLKQLIAERYEVIKYKKMEAIQEIQKIFKEHIEKSVQKIEKMGD